MGLKQYPFTTSGNYTISDSDKVEVAGGVAKLKGIPTPADLLFYGKFNNSLDAVYSKYGNITGNSTNASLTTSVKKFGAGGIEFEGKPSRVTYVGGGEIAQIGTISCFVRFADVYTETFVLMLGGGNVNTINFWYQEPNLKLDVYDDTGSIIFALVYSWSPNINTWYHLEADIDVLTGQSALFINGSEVASSGATGSRDAITTDLRLGRNLDSDPDSFFMDDVRIYDTLKHTSNFTPPTEELTFLSSDKPYIQPSSAFISGDIEYWTLFTETLGSGNEGSIAYILSDDDGSTWKYWNGSAWVTGGSSTNSNTAAEVNANLSGFPTESFLFRAYLVSDGTQDVELDALDIQYLGKTGFSWPFLVADNYVVSDSDKVVVENGLAKLLPPHFKNGDTFWDNIVALYHFDNGFTDSKNSYHGSKSGTGTGFSSSVFKLGEYSADFNGSDDYVSVNSFPYLQLGSGYNATIMFWIKLLYTDKYIITKNTDYSSASSFEFGIKTDVYGYLKFISNGSDQLPSSTSIADGEWHQVAVVLNGTSGTWYLDGTPDGTFTIGDNTEKAVSLLIGARRRVNSSDIGDFYGGKMDELAFIDTNLSATEVNTIYTTQNARNFPTDKPYIQPSTALDPESIVNWLSFSQTLAISNGSIGYVISNDGGATWDYYNSGWQYGEGSSINYNTATEITNNISTWDSVGPDTFLFRAYFISDGTQAIEIDTIAINYTLQAPFGSFLSVPTFFMEKKKSSFLSGLVLLEETLQRFITGNSDLLYEGDKYLFGNFSFMEKTKVITLTGQISLKSVKNPYLSGTIELVRGKEIYLSATFFMEKKTAKFFYGNVELVYTKDSYLAGDVELVYENLKYLCGKVTLVNYITPHNVSGIFQRLNNVMIEV